MEIITPPGHIYVRYHDGDKIINVETTARGIHLDCKEYLGIDTRSLQVRTLKEVIGMVAFNQVGQFTKVVSEGIRYVVQREERMGEFTRAFHRAPALR